VAQEATKIHHCRGKRHQRQEGKSAPAPQVAPQGPCKAQNARAEQHRAQARGEVGVPEQEKHQGGREVEHRAVVDGVVAVIGDAILGDLPGEKRVNGFVMVLGLLVQQEQPEPQADREQRRVRDLL